MDFNATGVIKCLSTPDAILSTASARINLIICSWASVICSLFVIGINTLFIWIVKFPGRKSLPMNDLYVLLSVCGLVTGLLSLPTNVGLMISYHKGMPNCTFSRIRMLTGYIFPSMSFTTVGFITLGTYSATVKPLLYFSQSRKERLVYLLTFCWIVSTLFVLICYYVFPAVFGIYKIVITSIAVFIFFFMVGCHIRMHIHLRKSFDAHAKRNKKIAKVALLILIVYCLCYIPAGINNVLIVFKGNSPFQRSYINPWVYFITMTNAFFDILLYGFRTKRIRNMVPSMKSI